MAVSATPLVRELQRGRRLRAPPDPGRDRLGRDAQRQLGSSARSARSTGCAATTSALRARTSALEAENARLEELVRTENDAADRRCSSSGAALDYETVARRVIGRESSEFRAGRDPRPGHRRRHRAGRRRRRRRRRAGRPGRRGRPELRPGPAHQRHALDGHRPCSSRAAATGESSASSAASWSCATSTRPTRCTLDDEVVTAGIELAERRPVALSRRASLIGRVVDVQRDAERGRPDRLPRSRPPTSTSSSTSSSSPTTRAACRRPATAERPVRPGRDAARGRGAFASARRRRSRPDRRPRPATSARGRCRRARARRPATPDAPMKGLVLAGGTATRLFPLTIVTNKHLLPIYDRPMIYYPLETLAGMGIREVMVIVGGKSVGDIVELLGDGQHFGLDLTYRYQRGALGIAHAIGLARDFVGDDAFCVVLGDNILRGPGARGRRARRSRTGPWGAGTLLYRVPDPERFGVAELDATGNVVGLRGEAGAAQERPHPDRRLLPAPGRVRRHRDTSRPPVAASSRSPTSSTTTSRTAACSPGSTRATGPTPAPSSLLLRAAEMAAGTPPWAGCRRRPSDRTTGAARTPQRHPTAAGRDRPTGRPRARLLVTGGAGFIGSSSCATSWPVATARGSRSSTSSPTPATAANLDPVRTTRSRPPGSRSSSGDIADPSRGRPARGRRPTPSSTSRPRPTSTARSSTPRRSCGPASSACTCCSRPSAARPSDDPGAPRASSR